MMQLESHAGKIYIIQIYVLTEEKDEDEVERFYTELEDILRTTKKNDITIILGDFNAKVCRGSVDNCFGQYSLGERNDRGEKLIRILSR